MPRLLSKICWLSIRRSTFVDVGTFGSPYTCTLPLGDISSTPGLGVVPRLLSEICWLRIRWSTFADVGTFGSPYECTLPLGDTFFRCSSQLANQAMKRSIATLSYWIVTPQTMSTPHATLVCTDRFHRVKGLLGCIENAEVGGTILPKDLLPLNNFWRLYRWTSYWQLSHMPCTWIELRQR